MLDEFFTKLPIRLQLAWACAGLSGTAHAVLHVLAVDCFGLGGVDTVSDLKPSVIARRIDKSKSQVNDAVRALVSTGFVARQSDGRLRLVLQVPAECAERVQALYRRKVASFPASSRYAAGKPAATDRESGHRSGQAAGKPDELAGKPATGPHKERARGERSTTTSSSSINSQDEQARKRRDDDDEVFKGALKTLLPALATAIAKQGRKNREETLNLLLSVKVRNLNELARAVASVLVAVRDQGFTVRESPAGLLFAAMKSPGDFPPADPVAEAAKLTKRTEVDPNDPVVLALQFAQRPHQERVELVNRFMREVRELIDTPTLMGPGGEKGLGLRQFIPRERRLATEAAEVEVWARKTAGQNSQADRPLKPGVEHERT